MKRENGPLHLVALTREGAKTALRLHLALEGSVLHLPARYAEGVPGAESFAEPVKDLLSRLWEGAKGFYLFMAAGIAVRSIAPLLDSKLSDPGVVALDPFGRFAIPLLSGHLGGANEMAERAAKILGGVAAITTATDAAGKPAVEVWAKKAGLKLENPPLTVAVNTALANGEPLALYVNPDLELPGNLGELLNHAALFTRSEADLALFEGAKVAVTHLHPGPVGALLLRPPVLALGVGSKKGVDEHSVPGLMVDVLRKSGYSELSVQTVASVDLKAAEPALKALAEMLGVPFKTYSGDELNLVNVPNPSERVRGKIGAPSVAEASALLASNGGRLILEKQAGADWTLAAALI